MSDLQRSETTLKSFSDHEMAFQLLRGLGVAGIGGGSLGEIMAITRNIPDGDVAAWVDEYERLAQQVLNEAGRARPSSSMVALIRAPRKAGKHRTLFGPTCCRPSIASTRRRRPAAI